MRSICLVLFSSVAMVGSALVGGNTNQDPSNPEYLAKAWGAVPTINDQASNNGPYYQVPIKVLSAKTQVVAGTKYTLQVLVGESTCKKGDLTATQITSSNCAYKSGGNRSVYEIVLWEKPWEDFSQYTVSKVRDVAATEQF